MYFGKVKAAAQRRAIGRVIVKPSDGTAYGTDSSGFFLCVCFLLSILFWFCIKPPFSKGSQASRVASFSLTNA